MGLFKKEPKVGKEISGGAWGHMVSVHHIDVDTLSRDFRCVDREGTLDHGEAVTFLRIFKPKDAEKKGVVVAGWETFDQHPDLVLFEGHLTRSNKACLEPRKA